MSGIGGWSGLYANRLKIKSAYPTIWDVPLVKKEMDRLLPNIKDGHSVLEIGAGDRRFEKKLRDAGRQINYLSMDTDMGTPHDYRSLDEISDKFDFIFMFELIEHLSPEEGLAMLKKSHGLLKDGGRVIVGTPNLYHPHRYFGDITHRTPYKYEELGGIMLMAGFGSVKAFRVYNDAFLRRALRLYLGVFLHRYLDIDFAGSILMEAEA